MDGGRAAGPQTLRRQRRGYRRGDAVAAESRAAGGRCRGRALAPQPVAHVVAGGSGRVGGVAGGRAVAHARPAARCDCRSWRARRPQRWSRCWRSATTSRARIPSSTPGWPIAGCRPTTGAADARCQCRQVLVAWLLAFGAISAPASADEVVQAAGQAAVPWQQLTPEQQRVLGRFAERWDGLAPTSSRRCCAARSAGRRCRPSNASTSSSVPSSGAT